MRDDASIVGAVANSPTTTVEASRRGFHWPPRIGWLTIGVALFGLLVWFSESPSRVSGDESTAAPRPPLPLQLLPNEQFASSSACRECHQEEHDSWHRTYHRTMTQTASRENFVGEFDGQTIDSDGLKYRVFMRGDEFWAEMPDPDEMIDRQRTYELKMSQGKRVTPPMWTDLPLVERQVVMSTGSHRYQTYWVESKRYPGTLMTLPLVYLIRDKRWIPREAAFVSPPDGHRMVTVWNDHCIKCHSTGSAPKPWATNDPQTGRVLATGFSSHVGEIGIACESCHGTGEEHVRAMRLEAIGGSLAAGQATGGGKMVHPGKLDDHRRASQICGQCHGVYIRNEEQGMRYSQEGIDYRPGDDLLTMREYIFPPQDEEFYDDPQERVAAEQAYESNPQFFRERFWDNGAVLAGGREFTALAVTKCYTKGTISCLSCHSMHESDPDDQLKPAMETSAACTQCHDGREFTTAASEHTHHAANSSGSNCLNCHMPHTTYALFSAIRNHQISSPDLAGSVAYGVPNACNLCHLDKSLAWTQEHLVKWYDYRPLAMSTEQSQISAALVWLLKGHAAQRVIVAWHVGWPAAQEASGKDWLAPFVARLLADPYGVVRYVGEHALVTLPGFEQYKYDFLASSEARDAAVVETLKQWQSRQAGPPSRVGRDVLISPDGRVVEPAVKWLLDRRDNRPTSIKE